MYSTVYGLTLTHDYRLSSWGISAYPLYHYFDTKKLQRFQFSTLGSALSTCFFFCFVKLYNLKYWWTSQITVLVLCTQNQKCSQNTVVFIENKRKQIPWWHTDPEDVWIYFYVLMLWIITHIILFSFSFSLVTGLQYIIFYFLASIMWISPIMLSM